MSNGQFFNSLNDTISNLGEFSGTLTNNIESASESIKGFELPAIKTESAFSLTPGTYVGIGALIIVLIYFIKK